MVTTKISDQNDGESQEQALRKALETCLREGQKVDMSFGIMLWKLVPPIYRRPGNCGTDRDFR